MVYDDLMGRAGLKKRGGREKKGLEIILGKVKGREIRQGEGTENRTEGMTWDSGAKVSPADGKSVIMGIRKGEEVDWASENKR